MILTPRHIIRDGGTILTLSGGRKKFGSARGEVDGSAAPVGSRVDGRTIFFLVVGADLLAASKVW